MKKLLSDGEIQSMTTMLDHRVKIETKRGLVYEGVLKEFTLGGVLVIEKGIISEGGLPWSQNKKTRRVHLENVKQVTVVGDKS